LAIKYEGKDSKKWIRNIKFSSDGSTLCVGSNDNSIFIYNTEDWASKGKCKAKDASMTFSHFDLALSGEWIMVNSCNKGELLYFDANSGNENARIGALKDVEWATWTCPYGWPSE